MKLNIRPANPEEAPLLLEIAVDSGLFPPTDISALSEMIDAYFAGALDPSHVWLVHEVDDVVCAAAYYAPEMMTDRVWNLLFIAVRERFKGQGLGSALLGHIERALQERGQRMLLIETSSLGTFAKTRAFYLKHSYEEEARLRDYYEPGDDKVVFRKVLTPT